MSVSRRLLARHIAERLAAGESQVTVMRELAAYIVTNRLTGERERIINDVMKQLSLQGDLSVRVVTAYPLTDELRKQIEAYAGSKFKARHVSLDEHVDPEIIGGIVLETPDKRYDSSIASKLKQLRNVTRGE